MLDARAAKRERKARGVEAQSCGRREAKGGKSGHGRPELRRCRLERHVIDATSHTRRAHTKNNDRDWTRLKRDWTVTGPRLDLTGPGGGGGDSQNLSSV